MDEIRDEFASLVKLFLARLGDEESLAAHSNNFEHLNLTRPQILEYLRSVKDAIMNDGMIDNNMPEVALLYALEIHNYALNHINQREILLGVLADVEARLEEVEMANNRNNIPNVNVPNVNVHNMIVGNVLHGGVRVYKKRKSLRRKVHRKKSTRKIRRKNNRKN